MKDPQPPHHETSRRAPRPRGVVHLVGAGPGDPELLTVKARRLLAEADLVAYDDLLHPALLELAQARATLLPVGYRGLRDEAMTREVLHPEVIAAAQAGATVVRLKCGDPLVLGRGGEEAQLLRRLGIPFTIVPGITAALGAAAYAGIPLTHRELAAGCRLVTAHLAQPPREVGSDGSGWAPGPQETVVLYMARKHLRAFCQRLLALGRPAETPAAFIISATTAAQREVIGTLATLPEQVAAESAQGPGLAIIGPTVGLRAEVSWRRARGPLAGERILVARARPGRSRLADELAALGADVVTAPLIRALPVADPGPLDQAIRQLELYEGLVLACEESVTALFARLAALGLDARDLPRRPVVALGDRAAAALRGRGWRPDFHLRGSCAWELTSRLGDWLRGRLLLLPVADRGRPQLVADLAALGARVATVTAYELQHHLPRIVAPRPSLVVLPSSSAARLVLPGELGFPVHEVPMIAIGPRTAQAAQAAGARLVRTAATDTPEAVVALALRLLRDAGQASGHWSAPQALALRGDHP